MIVPVWLKDKWKVMNADSNLPTHKTRRSRKTFWTDLKDLIFIDTNYNKIKAKELRNDITKSTFQND